MASEQQSLKPRQKTKYGSFDSSDDIKEYENDGNTKHVITHKKKLNEIRNCNEFCVWIQYDTCHKLQFLYFFGAIIIPFIIAFYYFIFEEYVAGYSVAGIFGICSSLYGLNHFRILFGLRHEVNQYEKLNNVFKKERKSLDYGVNKLKEGHNALKDTHKELEKSNLKMIDILRQFEHLEKDLNALNIKSINELSEISNKTSVLNRKYYEMSLQQQCTMLWRLFNRCQLFGDDKTVITKQEYDIFYNLLTREYQERFDRLGGFESLLEIGEHADKNYIDAKDFEKALTIYAQMHVENTDIKFKINRTISSKDIDDDEPKYTRSVTIISRAKSQGLYLKYDDVLEAAKLQEQEDGNMSVSATPTPMAEEPLLMHQRRINL